MLGTQFKGIAKAIEAIQQGVVIGIGEQSFQWLVFVGAGVQFQIHL